MWEAEGWGCWWQDKTSPNSIPVTVFSYSWWRSLQGPSKPLEQVPRPGATLSLDASTSSKLLSLLAIGSKSRGSHPAALRKWMQMGSDSPEKLHNSLLIHYYCISTAFLPHFHCISSAFLQHDYYIVCMLLPLC